MQEAGTVVADRYRLVKPLGRGGMGFVWLAEDSTFERSVAMKFGPALSDESHRRQAAVLAREAANGARLLGHQNIVPVLDRGVWKDEGQPTPYLVMQYAPGPTLSDFTEHNLGKLVDPNTRNYVALHLARQICEALVYSHESGVLHRDVKPANVILTAGIAKVTDFGLSRLLGEPTREETVRQWVSPHYAAPEQYDLTVNPTSATDAYQLAATTFELISGRTVFPDDNPGEAHRNLAPPRLKAGFNEWQFPEIADVIHKMLAKAPGQRPELWELHDLVCMVLVRPWRLTLREVPPSRRQVVADTLGFSEADLEAGIDHVYADEHSAFRDALRLMLNGLFTIRMEALTSSALGT